LRPRLRRHAPALVLAALVAGCGSGGGGGGEGEAAPAESVELAERCKLSAPLGGRPPADLFPPGLLPPDALIFRWAGEGLNARARVVFRSPMGAAQQAVAANAERLGLPVLFRETEVFDAELDVQSGDEVIRFAFSPARGCPREIAEAAVRKLAGPA
jgi:hypothetical protein